MKRIEIVETPLKPATRLLRRPEVESRVGLTCSTIYELMGDDNFPKPIPIWGRQVGWIEAEVEAWVVERIAAARKTK
jgi:prophage regulatory protein